jgi:hypothetical protein
MNVVEAEKNFAKLVDKVYLQGQLQLNRCSNKDFHQELVAPTAGTASHRDAVLARMLL